MQNPLKALTSVYLLRRLVQATERIALALEVQNILLGRLADQIAPVPPTVSEGDLRDSGPLRTRDRDTEQSEILTFVERFHKDVGREPTEEEIVDFLDSQAERAGG